MSYDGLPVTFQRKEVLTKPKKERTPRITVCGSHFAKYRKLCNGIAVSRTRTTFFVGQISNLLRYHYSTIPYPPYKTTLKTSSQLGQSSYLSYFRGFSRITDTTPHGQWAYLSGKVFSQDFASRLSYPVRWKTAHGQNRTGDTGFADRPLNLLGT